MSGPKVDLSNAERIYTVQCEICGKVFNNGEAHKVLSSLIIHVSNMHSMTKTEYSKLYTIDPEINKLFNQHSANLSKNTRRTPVFIAKANNKMLQKVGEDVYKTLPKCGICGMAGKHLYKHILEMHEMSLESYKSQYGDILASKDYLKNLSESRKGENNAQFGKYIPENNPFSNTFYIKRGYTQDEAQVKVDEMKQKCKDAKNSENEPTHFEYYMKHFNVSEQEARKMLRQRQTTCSVKNIASRNNISLEEAQLIRNDITNKWIATLQSKSIDEQAEINRKKIVHCVSKSSIKFFDRLLSEIKDDIDISNVLYDTLEMYMSYDDNGKTKFYYFDFTIDNKIIEFNGDIYHGNPAIYEATNRPMTQLKQPRNPTAQELWDYDAKKTELAISRGYEVLVIWEKDVKDDLINEINRCKSFMLNGSFS